MALTISVTKDVTSLDVSDSNTTLSIAPQTTTIGVANVAITQSNTASVIGYDPSGHLESTNVQSALDEIAASPEFTAALKAKLEAIEAQADLTDTDKVGDAGMAGDGWTRAADGTSTAFCLV